MEKAKTCIGVIFGGKSGEHNISIKSALTVIYALKEGINYKSFEVMPIYIDLKGRWWSSQIAFNALEKGEALSDKELPDPKPEYGFYALPKGHEEIQIWFPVLHGPNGEDGTIQGLLELIGKPFVGSRVLGSALGMDKVAMKAAFKAAGIPQVKYISLNAKELEINKFEDLLCRIESDLKYPLFIKPANLGSSVGITKAKNKRELISGLDIASQLDQRIVVEEGINARELECAVLGTGNLKVSEIGEINLQADWYDYNSKYSNNSTQIIIPAKISIKLKERIKELTLISCKAIAIEGIARVDFFYDEKNDDLLINEVNTLPGFTKQSMYPRLWEASGIPLTKLVSDLVNTARR